MDKILNEFNPNLELKQAYTPPGSWYTSPDFFKLERDKLFLSNWTAIESTSDLNEPGDFVTGFFMEVPYIVSIDGDSNLKGFFNICSHHGTCVAQGRGKTDKFICPYHGWTYNLCGHLKKAPQAGAIEDLMKKAGHLKTFDLKEQKGIIYANFHSSKNDMFSVVPDYIEHLNGFNFVARKKYSIGCNWKVFVDNYLDGGYHVPHMHPDLDSKLEFTDYTSETYPYLSVQKCAASTSNQDKKTIGKGAIYIYQFPNLMLNRYGHWLDLNYVCPISESDTEIVFEFYFDGIPTDEEVATRLQESDQTQKEDIEICDRVQKGLNSGFYNRGIYAPKFEAPMFEFHKNLHSCLTAEHN